MVSSSSTTRILIAGSVPGVGGVGCTIYFHKYGGRAAIAVSASVLHGAEKYRRAELSRCGCRPTLAIRSGVKARRSTA